MEKVVNTNGYYGLFIFIFQWRRADRLRTTWHRRAFHAKHEGDETNPKITGRRLFSKKIKGLTLIRSDLMAVGNGAEAVT